MSNEIQELSAGVVRTDRTMNDGRTIRYYDTAGQTRTAKDLRPEEDQPGIGELRLDPLVNEWVAMAAHRQGRIFLPPKELCPLCPTDMVCFFQSRVPIEPPVPPPRSP